MAMKDGPAHRATIAHALSEAQRLSARIADLSRAARSTNWLARMSATFALPFAKMKLRDMEARAIDARNRLRGMVL